MNARANEESDLAVSDYRSGTQSLVSEATASPLHIKNILVPIDFSDLSCKSLQYAIPIARQHGAKLTLVYVIEPLAYAPELPYGLPLPQDPLAQTRKDLEALRKSRIPADINVDYAVREDFAHTGVIDVARSLCVDLIITTTHGRTGIPHIFMGSTVEKIVQRAPCPVLVLNQPEHEFV
jgi:nucleotide-binding universal stress UspA family protein